MTHTYVTCPDCGRGLAEEPTSNFLLCRCGAMWTLAGARLAFPFRQRQPWQRWGSVTWARVILLLFLLALAVFVVTVMVD